VAALSVIDGAEEPGQRAPSGSLSVGTFKAYLEDCRFQPPWRNVADKCVDYYDGNQLDQETLAALERKGMGPLIRNITAPLINVVLGMEAKTRTDWRVSADTDTLQEVAEALSAELHEAERESRADKACSDGYAAEIKAGLGWVEVSRNADPFQYPYRVQYVHRREIWWDWRDDSADLHKARFLIRKRWFDLDQAVAYFPEHEEILRAALGDPIRYELLTSKRGLDLGMSLEEARGLDIEDIEEWRSFDRQRICLYEVWYRVFVRGWVARLPNGEVVEVDTKNPVHLALLNRGAMQAERAVYSKLRQSIWAGPHKMVDVATNKRHLPYVPFWGYREDRTGVPYGLVRAMISPQDEVNARLQKMMWLLGAKRVMLDSDALDPEMNGPRDMLDELARPDAAIFLKPNRTNRDALKVDDNLTLADAQFKVLLDAKQASQEVVGVFNAMLGRESSTTANSALVTLVDQGTTALAEINDNYRFARRLVGERLLDLRRDDLLGKPVEIAAGEPGRKRIISLNTPVQTQDPQTGQVVQQIKNNVAQARCKVALDDVLSSSAYREQQFTMLAELTKGLPPQLQSVIAPFVIEASDLKRRRDIADTLRKAMGQPVPKTPEEEKEAEAAMAEAMAFTQDVQRKLALADLAEKEAKAMQLRAQAEKAMAEARADPNLQGQANAEFEARVRDVERQAQEQIDKLTADSMVVKMNAAQREQKLLATLSATVAQLKANKGGADAERYKADTEKEIARIEQEKEVEVARIQADSQKVIDGLSEQITKMREEMLAKVEEAKKAADKAAEQAKASEQQRREDEKARKEEERKRKEEAKAEREREKQEREREKDKGGDVEVTVVKTGPGQFKATKKRKGGGK
jgi:hypothetical protein